MPSAKASSKQTKNTTPKENKKTKETKDKVVASSASDMEDQDQDQDQHSLWNGRLKRNPAEAKTVRDFIKLLHQHIVDDDGATEILKLVWGETQEALDSLITKANKRDKKKKDTYVAEGLKKPLTANHLFDKHFKVECDKNGTKFSLTNSSVAWQKLSDKEKNKFKKQAADDKAKYEAEYEKLRSEAIKNGDFPEDKPKGPCNGYLHYLAEMRPILNKKNKDTNLKGIDANIKITTDAAAMWSALSDSEKEKYNIIYRKEKVEYDSKMEAWTARETSRRKKLGGEAAEPEKVNIESTGKASKKKAKATVTVDTEDEHFEGNNQVGEDESEIQTEGNNQTGEEEEEEEEPVVVKPVKKATKTPVSKKTTDKKTKVKVESEEETPIETESEPVVEEKPKAKKTTTKKIKVESSDNDE